MPHTASYLKKKKKNLQPSICNELVNVKLKSYIYLSLIHLIWCSFKLNSKSEVWKVVQKEAKPLPPSSKVKHKLRKK